MKKPYVEPDDAGGTRLAAYAYIEDRGRILLTQLSDSEPAAGSWTLPGGGVDWGEHPIDALHRELHEETGLSGSVDDLLAIDSRVFPADGPTGRPALHAVRLIYRMSARGRPRVVEVGGSTCAVAWVATGDVDALPTIDLVAIARGHAANGS